MESIRKVLGICLVVAVSVAAMFSLVAVFIPETLMSFYTEDAEVIKLGSDYLRIVGLSYVLMAISYSYISILRSITQVKLTVVVSVLALTLKTALGYSLIFGHFGLPALGVRGAAIGTATGWAFECVLLLILVYARKTPLAANPLNFFHFDRPFLFNILRTSMPAALNEVIWSFGITFYYAVYARIGTDAIAAININATIEELMFVLFIGLGNACAVMVGNKIGEKEKETAVEYSRRFTIMAVTLALLGSVIVFFSRDFIASLYQVSDSAVYDLKNIRPTARMATANTGKDTTEGSEIRRRQRLSEMAVHNGVCYLAGQVAADGSQDITGQTRQVLAAVDALLARAGTDKSKILRVQIFIKDLADFPALNAVWEAWVPAGHAPPRATVQANLAKPEWRVEMVVTAAL